MDSCFPCSNQPSPAPEDAGAVNGGEDRAGRCVGDPLPVVRRRAAATSVGKDKGILFKTKRAERDAFSSSSSSPSSSFTSSSSRQLSQQRGVRLRSRRHWLSVSSYELGDEEFQDLALPLGMSFAAIVAKVLDVRNVSAERISVDHLLMICTSVVRESITNESRIFGWIPNPMASINSRWLILRCHVVVLSRFSFGILMIITIAYLIFQRSIMSGPTMPLTFIILLLGVCCGFAGKMCIDTLGGSGYHWLGLWEVMCLFHFFANVFPSIFYHVLYGPVSTSHGANVIRLPYWLRRCTFNSILLLILPTLAGLLPFASFHEWKEHFFEKLTIWSLGNE